ncbi:receptor-like protein 14 [Cajanus cajan]|uniref:receptor-like protein 14 n=1 Tax=Cajanus cajan TaxID=3821 RepID=UPI00098DA9AF|nr:receptor-like protein 14 [Cajanus cajan]
MVQKLDISYNHFIGNISSNLGGLASLEYLNLNKVILDLYSTFENWIPKFQLQVHSLSSRVETNSLPLPSFLYKLTYIDFTNCKLGGEFPNWLLENNPKMINHVLKNSILDFSYNELTNTIDQDIIQDLSYEKLSILLLKGNYFIGNIPSQLCQLMYLTILDLSYNNFSSEIPTCLGKIPFENISILAYMFGIDLSHNKLMGDIPSELRNLTFLTFEESNYKGNLFLCGLPLPKSCNSPCVILP